jgi:hypothetical protein
MDNIRWRKLPSAISRSSWLCGPIYICTLILADQLFTSHRSIVPAELRVGPCESTGQFKYYINFGLVLSGVIQIYIVQNLFQPFKGDLILFWVEIIFREKLYVSSALLTYRRKRMYLTWWVDLREESLNKRSRDENRKSEQNSYSESRIRCQTEHSIILLFDPYFW